MCIMVVSAIMVWFMTMCYSVLTNIDRGLLSFLLEVLFSVCLIRSLLTGLRWMVTDMCTILRTTHNMQLYYVMVAPMAFVFIIMNGRFIMVTKK